MDWLYSSRVCVGACLYIYIYVCVYIYIYITVGRVSE